MKKLLCVIMIAALLFPIASCAFVNGGDSTAAPQNAENTVKPSDPAAPTPSRAETDRSYDPMTDCDNMAAAARGFFIADTENAYYIHFEGRNYFRYFDKLTGDMDVLCPRPECQHDANTPNNQECLGFCGSDATCLSYYMGKLWWVGLHPTERDKLLVYCEEPDGSGREIVRTIDITDELHGECRFYFHRGRLYMTSKQDVIRDGTPGQILHFGYYLPDGGEFTEFFSAPSYVNVVATMRFIGDEIFMAAYYDGEEVSGVKDDDWDAYAELRSRIRPKTVIMRWSPDMNEPEVLFTTEEKYNYLYEALFYVSRDGTPYYARSHLADPEKEPDPETNPVITSAYRIDPDGTETELFDCRDGEKNYSMLAMSGGTVICIYSGDGTGNGMELWVRSLDGETIYKGSLELGYRDGIVSDETHMYQQGLRVLGNGREVFIMFRESFPDNEYTPVRYYLVRYELNGDKLAETLIGEDKAVNGVGD